MRVDSRLAGSGLFGVEIICVRFRSMCNSCRQLDVLLSQSRFKSPIQITLFLRKVKLILDGLNQKWHLTVQREDHTPPRKTSHLVNSAKFFKILWNRHRANSHWEAFLNKNVYTSFYVGWQAVSPKNIMSTKIHVSHVSENTEISAFICRDSRY